MNEKRLAKDFLNEIDKLIQGNYTPSKNGTAFDDTEEVKLAKYILKEDFSKESHLREALKKRLLDKFWKYRFSPDYELSEEELDYVAAGHSLKEDSACAKCGCKRSRSTIATATCPDCGHSRNEHM